MPRYAVVIYYRQQQIATTLVTSAPCAARAVEDVNEQFLIDGDEDDAIAVGAFTYDELTQLATAVRGNSREER